MRKSIFQGFSVFHLCGFYSVSAFLGAFFLAAIEKDAIFAIVKTKFAVSSLLNGRKRKLRKRKKYKYKYK